MKVEANALSSVIDDMLINCGRIQPGQRVTIVAASDGLKGAHNIVDRETVELISEGVRRLRANPSLLWLDMSQARAQSKGVPVGFEQEIEGSDIIVALIQDLAWEENSDFKKLLRTKNIPVIRNMATTVGMLSSRWGRLPYEICSEIRFAIGSLMDVGSKFNVTHENGTHLEGTINIPNTTSSFRTFTQFRTNDLYRPFPEGVYVPMGTNNLNGRLVFDGMMPSAAYYMNIPDQFTHKIELIIENCYVRRINGESEANKFERFLAAAAKEFGDEVYNVDAFHGGVHPYATLSPDECPNESYREFVEHHHISSIHFHIASNVVRKDIPHRLQCTAEVRGTSFQVNGVTVLDRGKCSALQNPRVLEIASRYMHNTCVRDLFSSVKN